MSPCATTPGTWARPSGLGLGGVYSQIMAKKQTKALIPVERIERSILLMRGHKVLLDRDLAELYGVKAIALRQQVRRNLNRFPDDFMFQLTAEEAEALVSQNVIPSRRSLGGFLPYAFTQEGVAMLSSVLRSERAVLVNIDIMRAFVRLRELLASHVELARRLDELEKKYDAQFRIVFEAIRDLMARRRPSRPGGAIAASNARAKIVLIPRRRSSASSPMSGTRRPVSPRPDSRLGETRPREQRHG